MPAVAVVVPTRNRARLLEQALDSVARQTFADWECLVVDDGSTDETGDLMAIREAADPRFRYVKRTRDKAGASACRNLGVRESASDFIVFLDSDDLLAPECLAHRVAVMRSNPEIDLAVFDGGVFHDAAGDLSRRFDTGQAGEDLNRFLALDPPWHTTGPIWRRAALGRLGGYDEDLLSWQDIDMHIRALAGGASYLRERVVDHHVRWKGSGDRISHRKAFETALFENSEPCVGKWRKALLDGKALSARRERALAGVTFHLSEQWATQGHTRKAATLWKTARALGIPRPQILMGTVFLAVVGRPLAANRIFRGTLRRWKVSAGLIRHASKRVAS